MAGRRAPEPARLAAVAAAAAIRSGLDAEVPVLPVAGVVSLPSLGAARVDADSAVVRSRPGSAEVRWAHGRVEIPPGAHRTRLAGWAIRGCRAGNLQTVIEDLDPFRMPAEVAGLAPRLTGARGAGLAASSPAGLGSPRCGTPCGRRGGRRRDFGHRPAAAGRSHGQRQFQRPIPSARWRCRNLRIRRPARVPLPTSCST